jgi:hypothetical protein
VDGILVAEDMQGFVVTGLLDVAVSGEVFA